MSFGIYKQGQGYWVRMMTAVFVGVLFLVGAAWGWDQAGALPIPAKGYDFTITLTDGEPQPGALVELDHITVEGSLEPAGTALVESYSAVSGPTGKLLLTGVDLAKGVPFGEVTQIRTQSQEASPFTARVNGWDAIPLFPRLYLQAGVAATVILLGAIVVYWFAGSNRRTVDFLVATDGEMKKVNWTTRKEIIGSTQVVIVAAILISLILFVIDLAFSEFFQLIGVLES